MQSMISPTALCQHSNGMSTQTMKNIRRQNAKTKTKKSVYYQPCGESGIKEFFILYFYPLFLAVAHRRCVCHSRCLITSRSMLCVTLVVSGLSIESTARAMSIERGTGRSERNIWLNFWSLVISLLSWNAWLLMAVFRLPIKKSILLHVCWQEWKWLHFQKETRAGLNYIL